MSWTGPAENCCLPLRFFAEWIGPAGSGRTDGPVVTNPRGCPDDAANWSSTAFSPVTRLFYFLALEECTGSPLGYPDQTGQRFLRALNIETGKIVWEVPQPDAAKAKTWSGVLATAGGAGLLREAERRIRGGGSAGREDALAFRDECADEGLADDVRVPGEAVHRGGRGAEHPVLRVVSGVHWPWNGSAPIVPTSSRKYDGALTRANCLRDSASRLSISRPSAAPLPAANSSRARRWRVHNAISRDCLVSSRSRYQSLARSDSRVNRARNPGSSTDLPW